MPIYAYRCESCGFAKDVLQKMSDAPLALCPQCGQDAFRKQVTAAGFQLKGSGWYVTDFRNNNSAPAKKAAGDATGAAAGTDGAPSAEGQPAGQAPAGDKSAPAGNGGSAAADSSASAAGAGKTSSVSGATVANSAGAAKPSGAGST